MKRRLSILLLALVMAATVILPVYAITIEDSFYYGTKKVCTKIEGAGALSVFTWEKSCWAGTSGYTGYHYVRAYIGGSFSNPAGAWADTGRRYSNGNIRATCVAENSCGPDDIIYFPKGFAKYGTT